MRHIIHIILLTICCSGFLFGCSDDNKSPVNTTSKMDPLAQDDEDKALSAGDVSLAGASVIWAGTSYGVRNGGRQAWRVPKAVNAMVPNVFRVCFPGDRCYVGKKVGRDTVARYPNGTFILYPNKKRMSSHKGIYIHSKYGYKGKKAYIVR